MTAKQWLMRARKLECRIASLVTARQRAYDRAVSTTSRPRDVCVLGGASGDKAASYVVVADSVRAQEDNLNRVRSEILDAIGMVEDNTLATLLTEYYINNRTWEEVAVALNYSWEHIIRCLHPKALRKIEDIIKCHV